MAIKNVSLDIHAGEILGIAGVAGNGQKELAEAVAGLRKVVGGTITINGGRCDNAGCKSTCEEKSRLHSGRQTEHGAGSGNEYGRKPYSERI